MFEFEEFKKEVISNFRELLSQHELDLKLENPTPGNLRDLSLKLFAHGLSKEDTQVFQDFFNPTKRYDDLETSIRRFPLDKLKPLKNFIKAKTSNPDEDIVKLLAILTQFDSRPFHNWRELRHAKKQAPEFCNPDRNEKAIVPEADTTAVDQARQEQENHIAEEEIVENIEVEIDYAEAASDKEFALKNKDKKKGRLSREETPWEKPPSKRTSMKLQVTFANFQLKQLIYLMGMIAGMFFLYAVSHFLIAKQRMCLIEVQYVSGNHTAQQPYSEFITVDPEHPNYIKIKTYPDTLTGQAISPLQISKTNNNVEFSTAPDASTLQDLKLVKDPNHYIILLYPGEVPVGESVWRGP
jgi:hypothetical protein